MKLYELPKGTKILEECSDGSAFLTFDHLDGMYSYCITEKGGVVHPGASSELEKTEGGYKFKRTTL